MIRCMVLSASLKNMAFKKFTYILLYDNIAISDNIFALMMVTLLPLISTIVKLYNMLPLYTKHNIECCENNIENSLTPLCRMCCVYDGVYRENIYVECMHNVRPLNFHFMKIGAIGCYIRSVCYNS